MGIPQFAYFMSTIRGRGKVVVIKCGLSELLKSNPLLRSLLQVLAKCEYVSGVLPCIYGACRGSPIYCICCTILEKTRYTSAQSKNKMKHTHAHTYTHPKERKKQKNRSLIFNPAFRSQTRYLSTLLSDYLISVQFGPIREVYPAIPFRVVLTVHLVAQQRGRSTVYNYSISMWKIVGKKSQKVSENL